MLALLTACAAPPPTAELVGPGAHRVLIEVDAFESCPPEASALEALAATARRECGGKHVELRRGAVNAPWTPKMGDAIDRVFDEARDLARLPPRMAYVHVLYCPADPWTNSVTAFGLCRRRARPFPHHQILIYKGTLSTMAALPKLEIGALDRADLHHEFGHALGIREHCDDTRCVMTKPTPKAIIDNALRPDFPADYCTACRAELEARRRGRP